MNQKNYPKKKKKNPMNQKSTAIYTHYNISWVSEKCLKLQSYQAVSYWRETS